MISVMGEGKVSVTPDRAIITLGVITESQNLSEAQKENNGKMSSIINSLLQLGILKENIKTTEFRIETQYDYVEGKQVFRGYKITNLLQVTTDQVASVGRVIDTAVLNGANYVSNIQFTVSDPQVFYNQALSLALIDSLQKAEVLARTVGATLIRVPLDIQELSQTVPQPMLYRSATVIQPGELDIVAKIMAKYSYG